MDSISRVTCSDKIAAMVGIMAAFYDHRHLYAAPTAAHDLHLVGLGRSPVSPNGV